MTASRVQSMPWVKAAGASSEMAAELLKLLERARIAYVTWRDTYRRSAGPAGKRVSVAQLEAQANRIRGFQPTIALIQRVTAELRAGPRC